MSEREMKLCQARMLKSCHIEKDPFIGCCKVYECSVTGLCYPCMLDISTKVILEDTCSDCKHGSKEEV